ncbi:MAG TPA: hypothetical protein VJ464_15050 [Blastocatellia bacterium]|nr:hypothetical protein [Blastocatellia bacterium]
MKTQRSNRRTAISALLALALLIAQSFALSTRAAGPDVDLSNEQRNVSSFLNDLSQLDALVSSATGPQLTPQLRARLATQGDTVKRRIADFQNDIRAAITKLKAAGLYESLDQRALARVRSAKLRSFIQEHGGARKVLESAIVVIAELRGDIDQTLRDLNAHAGAQTINELDLANGSASQFQGYRVIRAGYHPEPAFGKLKQVFKCLVSAGAYLLASSKENNGAAVQTTEEAFDKNC